MAWTLSATRRGSSRSSSAGLPVSIWQKSHRRVHCSPPIRNVASRSSQHSKVLGQPASSHTVCRPSRRTRPLSSVYSGPILARVLIHGGLRSMGVSAFRTSRRSSFRPSGTTVTDSSYVQSYFESAVERVTHRSGDAVGDVLDGDAAAEFGR